MMWDNNKCILLIQIYEKEEVLWNPKSENYYNKNLKQDAWRRIAEILCEDISEVKKKISALLGSYRRERSREKKSQITGSGTDSIYKSKWFAYESFSFLSDKDDPRETLDTMPTDENSQPVLNSLEPAISISTQASSSASLPPARRAAKRKADPMLDEAMNILRNTAQRHDDSNSCYGNYIANELKKYDRMTIANIKYAINNILYQADMGYYSSYNASQEYGYRSGCSTSRSSTATSQYSYSSVASPPPPPPPPPPPVQDDSGDEYFID